MINANTVRELAESHLAGGTGFLVDVRVSDGNAISILLDDDEGTSIEKCMALSRHIESFDEGIERTGLFDPVSSLRHHFKPSRRIPFSAGTLVGEAFRIPCTSAE